MRSETAKELLAETARARSRARAGRRGAWFALCVFGTIVLAAVPLYVATEVAGLYDGPSRWEPIGSLWLAQYWVFAVPLAYLVCLGYYHRRAQRTGVVATLWPWVLTGLVLLTLMTLVSHALLMGWIASFPVRWESRPLFAVAGGFLVLAWLERNPFIAALSVVLMALPGMCGRIYDSFIGWRWFSGIGLATLVAGLVLLCAGAFARTMEGRER